MSKFTVGDRVRLICPFARGTLGTVIGIPEDIHVPKRLKQSSYYVRRDPAGPTDCLRYHASELELVKPTTTPHQHAALIKAWADGAEIQSRAMTDMPWLDDRGPTWDVRYAYRIKPEPKPDVVVTEVYSVGHNLSGSFALRDKVNGTPVKFTFDGETGKLKSVELIGA